MLSKSSPAELTPNELVTSPSEERFQQVQHARELAKDDGLALWIRLSDIVEYLDRLLNLGTELQSRVPLNLFLALRALFVVHGRCCL